MFSWKLCEMEIPYQELSSALSIKQMQIPNFVPAHSMVVIGHIHVCVCLACPSHSYSKALEEE